MQTNKTLRENGGNIIAFGCAIAAFLVCSLLLEFLVRAESGRIEANRRSEAVSHASALRSQVDRELNALLFVSGGMASYLNVYHDELDPEKIQAILADLYSRTRHVRNLAIAVDYKITYVYPVNGNEKAIGLDYRKLSNQWPQVKQAVDTRKGVLAGPLDLVQGGKGLIYRYPLFFHDQYWGLLSTVITPEPFLQAAFAQQSNGDYEFAIRTVGVSAQAGEVFYGKPGLFDDPAAFRIESDVPNGKWEWALLKKTDASSRTILIMRLMGFAISLLVSSVVFFFVWERTLLTRHAMYDALTGLANRRLLEDRLAQAFAQGKRFGRSMAVMYVDLDHFKQLNDTQGHDFGDAMLKSVAIRLAECIRNVDTLSRVGGDEFVIVLEEISQPQDAYRVAESILAKFREPVLIQKKMTAINLSIGIAIYQPDTADAGFTVDDLLKQADMAMYAAKAAGKDGYRVFGR